MLDVMVRLTLCAFVMGGVAVLSVIGLAVVGAVVFEDEANPAWVDRWGHISAGAVLFCAAAAVIGSGLCLVAWVLTS